MICFFHKILKKKTIFLFEEIQMNDQNNDNKRTSLIDSRIFQFFIKESKTKKKRFVKFALVSIGGLGLTLGIVALMGVILDATTLPEPLFSIPFFKWTFDIEKIILQQFVAIIIVTIYNYFLNKLWTFKEQESRTDFNTTVQFIKFAIVGASGTVVNLGLVYIFATLLSTPDLLASAIGFIVSVITNYILNEIWTFNPKYGKERKESEITE